jgi:hemerythrin-like metal-binding protein
MSWTDTGRLHELVEKLQEQVQEPATRSAILITLNELNTYAEKVFEQEEVFLSKMRSVDLKSRQTLHKRLLKQLAHHTQDFKDDPTPKVCAEFITFLQAWVQLQEKTLAATSVGREVN